MRWLISGGESPQQKHVQTYITSTLILIIGQFNFTCDICDCKRVIPTTALAPAGAAHVLLLCQSRLSGKKYLSKQ